MHKFKILFENNLQIPFGIVATSKGAELKETGPWANPRNL